MYYQFQLTQVSKASAQHCTARACFVSWRQCACVCMYFLSQSNNLLCLTVQLCMSCVFLSVDWVAFISLCVCVCVWLSACLRDFVMKVRSVEGVTAEAGYLKHFQLICLSFCRAALIHPRAATHVHTDTRMNMHMGIHTSIDCNFVLPCHVIFIHMYAITMHTVSQTHVSHIQWLLCCIIITIITYMFIARWIAAAICHVLSSCSAALCPVLPDYQKPSRLAFSHQGWCASFPHYCSAAGGKGENKCSQTAHRARLSKGKALNFSV